MLTLTLRGLERDGLVTRTVFPTIPPRVDYELTKLGRSLLEPVSGLGLWARQNRAAIEEARQPFRRAPAKPQMSLARANCCGFVLRHAFKRHSADSLAGLRARAAIYQRPHSLPPKGIAHEPDLQSAALPA